MPLGAHLEVGLGVDARAEQGEEPQPVLPRLGRAGAVEVGEEERRLVQIEIRPREEQLVDGAVLGVGGAHQDVEALRDETARDAREALVQLSHRVP